MTSSHLFVINLISMLFLGAGCAAPTNKPPATTPSGAPSTATTSTEPTTVAPPVRVTPPRPPTAQPTKPPPPKNQTVVVTIKNFTFSPQAIAMNDGDTVMWINADPVPHTSTFDSALLWDSGNLPPGASYKRVFHTGTYHYHCGIHPNMKGTVIVR